MIRARGLNGCSKYTSGDTVHSEMTIEEKDMCNYNVMNGVLREERPDAIRVKFGNQVGTQPRRACAGLRLRRTAQAGATAA